jgi:hypothetical protein
MSKLVYSSREPFWQLVLIDIELFVQPIHQPDIHKNEDHKDKDGSLLSKPETELEATYPNLIEDINQQDAESERGDEPNGQKNRQISKVFLPIELPIIHTPVPFQSQSVSRELLSEPIFAQAAADCQFAISSPAG